MILLMPCHPSSSMIVKSRRKNKIRRSLKKVEKRSEIQSSTETFLSLEEIEANFEPNNDFSVTDAAKAAAKLNNDNDNLEA
jgi:hypothetical protein